tara:strand:+ start:550 stop:687 length:138 start_codon:yes stop_codon:yes gene_type:complete
MPIRKAKNGWSFGGAVYDSLEKAKKSYRAYLAKKHSKSKRKTRRA